MYCRGLTKLPIKDDVCLSTMIVQGLYNHDIVDFLSFYMKISAR